MSNSFRRCLYVLSAFMFYLLLPFGVVAEPHKPGAHEHGKATLKIGYSGEQLEIELVVPAADLVGFERAPISESEVKKVAAVKDVLADGKRLFSLPDAAHCSTAERAHVESDFAEAEGGHSDFEVIYRYKCTSLERFEIRLFSEFPAITSLTVELITDTEQRAVVLLPPQSVVVVKGEG